MGTNTKIVRNLIEVGLLALAMLLALCAAAWVPSAYADTPATDQDEVATGESGDDPEAALYDISKYSYDYKEYFLYQGREITLDDLAITLYRYDEAGNKVTLASNNYGDPTWYFKAQAREIPIPYYQGAYTVTLHGKGNYEGSSLKIDFEAVDDDDLHLASITDIEQCYVYTGSKIKPTPKLVMPDGTVLVEGRDYTIELNYRGEWQLEEVDVMQQPGKYWYYFSGLGKYEYSYTDFDTRVVEESERISLKDEGIRIFDLNASYPYTGSAIKPPVIVRHLSNGNVYELVEGGDYTVAYKDNVAGSTATIVITGKGLYKDSLTKTFAITGVPDTKGLDVGKTAKIGGAIYKVTDNVKSTVVYQKAPKNRKSVVIPASVKINGKAYTVVGIAKGAFKSAKAKTVTVKAKALTKKSVKGCFKGAKKLKTVKVKVGNKKANKKFVKKYKKAFAKKNAGKKVAVK